MILVCSYFLVCFGSLMVSYMSRMRSTSALCRGLLRELNLVSAHVVRLVFDDVMTCVVNA